MGLFILSLAGTGFTLIGAYQALISLHVDTNQPNSSQQQSKPIKNPSLHHHQQHSSCFFFLQAASALSLLFIVNSFYSLFDAVNARDRAGSVLQLQVLAVSSLFLLYCLLCLFNDRVTLPSSILELVLLFGFIEEFLLFYAQRKDASGIENRYFDLLLVPILICVVSTVLELNSSDPGLSYARLVRGLGLILQGTWFLQMGVSFYSSWIVHGCALHEKSRGNYTVRCKGHAEYHRGRAIATLQFNCHLALLVVLSVVLYSVVSKKNGLRGDFAYYKPLRLEIQQFENARFTLDSDSDDDNGIKQERNVGSEKGAMVELTVNGKSNLLL